MMNNMSAYEHRGDPHPMHARNEQLEQEITALRAENERLKDEIRKLDYLLKTK